MKFSLQKTFFIYVFLFFFWNATFCQANYTGTIYTNENTPLSYVSVIALSLPDSAFISGTTTDDIGQFELSLEKNFTGLFQIVSIGYSDQFVSAVNGQTDYSIILNQSDYQLNEVVVTGKKPMFEQKIDRLVVNVSNSITASGGTALEVLQRSPGVIVNKQWNTIALNGNEGIVLMINGKISRIPANAVVNMLEGMTAENIEKIELIHTPPANFEAEGNAGIIHIVLKESADRGFNGTVSLFGGYGLGEKYGVNTNFNYRKKKVRPKENDFNLIVENA